MNDGHQLIAGIGTRNRSQSTTTLHRQQADREKQKASNLDEVSHVAGELLNNSVVEPLDVLQQSLVILDDKVDGNSLAPKSA